jgi:hypothetical protein
VIVRLLRGSYRIASPRVSLVHQSGPEACMREMSVTTISELVRAPTADQLNSLRDVEMLSRPYKNRIGVDVTSETEAVRKYGGESVLEFNPVSQI